MKRAPVGDSKQEGSALFHQALSVGKGGMESTLFCVFSVNVITLLLLLTHMFILLKFICQ